MLGSPSLHFQKKSRTSATNPEIELDPLPARHRAQPVIRADHDGWHRQHAVFANVRQLRLEVPGYHVANLTDRVPLLLADSAFFYPEHLGRHDASSASTASEIQDPA